VLFTSTGLWDDQLNEGGTLDETLQEGTRTEDAVRNGARSKGLVWGLAGGVAATIVIDLITAAVLPLMGSPADGGFTVIGDTAAGFLALFGMQVAGGALLGAVLHYLIGAALGVLFGLAVTRIAALRLTSLKKGVGLGILYTEIISLPILVTPPIILHWSGSQAAFWFGFSFVMHAIWGAVLGAVVARGLRPSGGRMSA
jgi:hypothetical protein